MSTCRSQRPWWRRLARVVAPLPALALVAIIGGCGGGEAEHMSDGPPSPTTTPTEPSRPLYEPDSVTQPPVIPDDMRATEPTKATTDEPAGTTTDAPAITPLKPTLDTPDTTAPSDTPKAEDDSAETKDKTPEKAEEPQS